MKGLLLLFKSHVKAHASHTKTGTPYQVKDYDNKVQKKPDTKDPSKYKKAAPEEVAAASNAAMQEAGVKTKAAPKVAPKKAPATPAAKPKSILDLKATPNKPAKALSNGIALKYDYPSSTPKEWRSPPAVGQKTDHYTATVVEAPEGMELIADIYGHPMCWQVSHYGDKKPRPAFYAPPSPVVGLGTPAPMTLSMGQKKTRDVFDAAIALAKAGDMEGARNTLYGLVSKSAIGHAFDLWRLKQEDAPPSAAPKAAKKAKSYVETNVGNGYEDWWQTDSGFSDDDDEDFKWNNTVPGNWKPDMASFKAPVPAIPKMDVLSAKARYTNEIDASQLDSLKKVKAAIWSGPAPKYDSRAVKAKLVADLAERLKGDKDFAALAIRLSKRSDGVLHQEHIQEDHTQDYLNKEDYISATVNEMIGMWAGTSGDHDLTACALQHECSRLFGLNKVAPGGVERSAEECKRAFTFSERKGMQAFARAVYHNTQDAFKKAGIKEVAILRGMTFRKLPEGAVAYHEKLAPDAQDGAIALQPLSSFSTSAGTARSFGIPSGGEYGVVMALTVPAARVWSSCYTGPGCEAEEEYILLGGEDVGECKYVASNKMLPNEMKLKALFFPKDTSAYRKDKPAAS